MALLAGAGLPALAEVPVEAHGSIGYNFRSLKDPQGQRTIDNQLLGTINLSSFVIAPWLATTEVNITGTVDRADYNGNASNANTDIVTGEVHLNLLPQSRSPFQLIYAQSDSRVSTFSIDQPLVVYKDQYQTRRLQVLQSYISEAGHRLTAVFDHTTYDSKHTGNYEDNKIGLEADIHLPRNHVLGSANYESLKQTSDASPQTIDTHKTDRVFLDLNNFWYPTSEIRVDSMVTYNKTSQTVDLPALSSNQFQDSNIDLGQVSSFLFYRPETGRLTASGGIRLYNMKTSASIPAINTVLTGTQTNVSQSLSNELSLFNVSATGGAIYQHTKNLRFDGNIEADTSVSQSARTFSTQERLGGLFQSDIMPVLDMNYQWFFDLSGTNQTYESRNVQTVVGTLSQNLQRSWKTSPDAVLSTSFSQAITENYQSVTQVTDNLVHTLTNSAYVDWNQAAWNGTTTLRLTLSDIRDLGGQDQQQLINFQATRAQRISRRSSLSGDLTLQNVHQKYTGQQGAASVTTATGRVNYNYSGLFGVPLLDFLSDLYIAKASQNTDYNRLQWENRLTYNIGQLYTSASYQLIQYSGATFDLIYFQVARHF